MSLPYDDIIHDEHMESLRNKVRHNGWDDPLPETLHVYRLPNGSYVVGYGGNHRAILSNELGLTSIKADVTVIIPVSEIPQHIINRITELEHTSSQLQKELRQTPDEDFQKHRYLNNQIVNCDEEKNNLLRAVVERLGWIPT